MMGSYTKDLGMELSTMVAHRCWTSISTGEILPFYLGPESVSSIISTSICRGDRSQVISGHRQAHRYDDSGIQSEVQL